MGFAGLGAWTTREMARQIDHARPTKGVVRESRVARERRRDERGGYDIFIPRVRYEYEVDGRAYSSGALYPGAFPLRTSSQRSGVAAAKVVRRYAAGTVVTVWYQPDAPGRSFLIRQRPVWSGVLALGGGILAVASVGLLLPMLVPRSGARSASAAVVFVAAMGLIRLIWVAFPGDPPGETTGPVDLLNWLVVAYALVGWAAFIANAPRLPSALRDATFAGLVPGVTFMSLSLFVLIPLMLIAPGRDVLRALPWIGVAGALLGLIGWSTGVVTLGRNAGRGDDSA